MGCVRLAACTQGKQAGVREKQAGRDAPTAAWRRRQRAKKLEERVEFAKMLWVQIFNECYNNKSRLWKRGDLNIPNVYQEMAVVHHQAKIRPIVDATRALQLLNMPNVEEHSLEALLDSPMYFYAGEIFISST
jgi:hypothetical protein